MKVPSTKEAVANQKKAASKKRKRKAKQEQEVKARKAKGAAVASSLASGEAKKRLNKNIILTQQVIRILKWLILIGKGMEEIRRRLDLILKICMIQFIRLIRI